MILSGLRVFDIRDPENPKEIAYHVAPPVDDLGDRRPGHRRARELGDVAAGVRARARGDLVLGRHERLLRAARWTREVWPFPSERGPRAAASTTRASSSVGARARRGAASRLSFERRADAARPRRRLPRVDGPARAPRAPRRALRPRPRSRSVTWAAARPVGRGLLLRPLPDAQGRRGVRHAPRRDRARRARAASRARPAHHRRDSCELLRAFKLERPVFGGTTRTPLRRLATG